MMDGFTDWAQRHATAFAFSQAECQALPLWRQPFEKAGYDLLELEDATSYILEHGECLADAALRGLVRIEKHLVLICQRIRNSRQELAKRKKRENAVNAEQEAMRDHVQNSNAREQFDAIMKRMAVLGPLPAELDRDPRSAKQVFKEAGVILNGKHG